MTDVLTIEIDTSELERAWDRSLGTLRAGIVHAVDAAVHEGAEEARTKHRYVSRTGTLTDSIKGELTHVTLAGAEGEIVVGATYASFVEDGTKPHPIAARKAKSLRWEDADGVHFAKVVQHPGTKPDGFAGNAMQKAERVLYRDIEVAAEDAANEMK